MKQKVKFVVQWIPDCPRLQGWIFSVEINYKSEFKPLGRSLTYICIDFHSNVLMLWMLHWVQCIVDSIIITITIAIIIIIIIIIT